MGEEGENFICWSAGRPNQSEVVRTADEPRRLPCDTSHAWTANLAQPILHAACLKRLLILSLLVFLFADTTQLDVLYFLFEVTDLEIVLAVFKLIVFD